MGAWKSTVVVLAAAGLAVTGCGGEPSMVAVPAVEGMALPDARSELDDAGFDVDEVDDTGQDRVVFSPGNWTVVSQDPPGGLEVEEGTTVAVRIVNVRDEDPADDPAADEPAPDVQEELNDEPDEPAGGDLQADVSAGPDGLRIVTEVDVHDCRVDLNPGVIRSGYTTRLVMLTAGEPYTVPWGDLTNRDGERFSYATHRPEMVTISCLDEDDRHLVDTWSW